MCKVVFVVLISIVSLLPVVGRSEISSFLDKVIYGEDNTVNINGYFDERLVKASKAVAVMVSNEHLIDYGSIYELIEKKLYRDNLPLCDSEQKYRNRIYSKCTGFLVDDDILITAGHCVPNQQACIEGNNKWIFGHNKGNQMIEGGLMTSRDNVYHCKKVLEIGNNFNSIVQKDYAVIKLNRKVQNIKPLKYRFEGKIENHSELAVIGYPSGRSLIIADEGQILDNSFFYFFKTNLDSFKGNSGAPVINMETGIVEGILLSGETDYELNQEKDCLNIKRCTDDTCRGEDVFRITGIDYIAPDKRSWLTRLLDSF